MCKPMGKFAKNLNLGKHVLPPPCFKLCMCSILTQTLFCSMPRLTKFIQRMVKLSDTESNHNMWIDLLKDWLLQVPAKVIHLQYY